jgi:hypothetical protein
MRGGLWNLSTADDRDQILTTENADAAERERQRRPEHRHVEHPQMAQISQTI